LTTIKKIENIVPTKESIPNNLFYYTINISFWFCFHFRIQVKCQMCKYF